MRIPTRARHATRALKRLVGSINRFSSVSPTSYYAVERAEWTFYTSYLQEGMIVFDVGANVGLLTLFFSHFVRSAGQVHAFEPVSATFARLKTICELAQCQNVTLNQAAVTDQPGVAQLNLYDTAYSTWNTMAQRPLRDYGIAMDSVAVEDVTTLTIDSYCEQHRIDHIDLLKIDVEGAEYQVLLGARRMLTEKRIAGCIFEFGQTTADMGNTPAAIRMYLNEVDYHLRNVVRRDPLFPTQAGTAQFAMHVATPR